VVLRLKLILHLLVLDAKPLVTRLIPNVVPEVKKVHANV
jgi:hypothetical protein